jgi:UDP-glucose 4-epimerase
MFGSDIVTIRPFNNYGPRQNDQALAAVVPLTIRRVLAGGTPVIEGDGTQTRDFIFVADTVDAILRLTTAETPAGAVFNVGSGVETEIGVLVGTLAKLLGWQGVIEQRPARLADVARHCADVSRAEALLGPLRVTPLDDGLAHTVAWHRQRPVARP